MSNQKVTLKEWQQFSNSISVSKQAVQQLSKLYIIIHEGVKSTIKNSVINPNTNFSAQIQHHIEFIQNVLQKIRNTTNDQYLVEIEKSLLKKYEKSLLNLLNQIQIMLTIQESKLNLTTDQLKAIKRQKRSKYDLRNQIQQSGKRIIRAKSGYKVRTNQNQHQKAQKNKLSVLRKVQNDESSFFPTTIQIENNKQKTLNFRDEKDLQTAFESKRQRLTQTLRKSMSPSKNGLGVSFQNKYEQNYLQMYFNERKDFADLIFNQEVYDQIILENHSKTETSETQKMESNLKSLKGMKVQDINQKLFPQFQIKTKFLKPTVKSKISNLITEIKKDLLKQYFVDNIQTLKEINEKEKLKPQQKKSSHSLTKNRSHSLASIHKQKKLKSNIKQKQSQQRNQQFTQTEYLNKNYASSLVKNKKSYSYSQLNKIGFQSVKTKKSFLQPNSKPFYQTSKWNQQIKKKYQNKVISKLIKAKLL